MKLSLTTLCLTLSLLCLAVHAQPLLPNDPVWTDGTAASAGFPQDDMESYSAGSVVNLLNGGLLWDGPYAAGTYSNMVNQTWYGDAYDEYGAGTATNLVGGTNWIHVVDRESYTITVQGWTNYYVFAAYTNLFNWVWYADAADEYSETANLDGLAGGTNWVLSLMAWDAGSSTNTVGWTNLYAARGFTNLYNTVWFADAMDEYSADAGLTNLAGGTNWIYVLQATNSLAQDLATTQGWTNLYAAKDY